MLVIFVALVFALVQVVPSTADPTGTRCPPVQGVTETCVCKSDKGVIDLRYLANNDGTPRYRVV